MEKIRILNKLLLVTYNLGGLCLILIGHMRGIGAPTGLYPGMVETHNDPRIFYDDFGA
ncbi:MAG: hypothetical protein ACTJG1_11265 [Enterococcus gilvus]